MLLKLKISPSQKGGQTNYPTTRAAPCSLFLPSIVSTPHLRKVTRYLCWNAMLPNIPRLIRFPVFGELTMIWQEKRRSAIWSNAPSLCAGVVLVFSLIVLGMCHSKPHPRALTTCPHLVAALSCRPVIFDWPLASGVVLNRPRWSFRQRRQ